MYDNEKILQIMPAPEGLRYSYDEGKTTEQVSFLALVELCHVGQAKSEIEGEEQPIGPMELTNGDGEVHAYGAENCEFFTDLTENGATLVDTSSC